MHNEINRKGVNNYLRALYIILCGSGLFTIGMIKNIRIVGLFISFIGFAMGMLDTAGNVKVLKLWDKDGEETTRSSVIQARILKLKFLPKI